MNFEKYFEVFLTLQKQNRGGNNVAAPVSTSFVFQEKPAPPHLPLSGHDHHNSWPLVHCYAGLQKREHCYYFARIETEVQIVDEFFGVRDRFFAGCQLASRWQMWPCFEAGRM